jgi:hypothetical protein
VTAAQARERLLNLYPAHTLRSAWTLGNVTKEKAVEELAKTKSTSDVNDFAFEHIPLTKQHVHLLEPSPAFNMSALPTVTIDEGPILQRAGRSEAQFFYLPDLRFEIVFLDSLNRQYIDFKWPILIDVRRDLLQVKFTTIEKDLRTFFHGERVTVSRRSVDEKAILHLIEDQFRASSHGLRPLDINKGIKALWAQDYIDSQEARWKKSRSTANEVMDERFFLKRDLPDMYDAVRRAPILKAEFEFMKDRERYVPHFVVEANNGVLRFPLYSNRRESTLDVIAKILELN